MSEAGRVELTVLGHALSVRTAADPAYLRSLAAYLEERVTALRQGGVRDEQTALIMAALDIVDELFRARDDASRDEGVVARLDALRALLDAAAPPPDRPR